MNDIDYGTPAIIADREVCLNIDGVAVSVPAGTSVMPRSGQSGDDDSQTLRHRFIAAFRLLPLVPGRDRRPARLSVFMYDAPPRPG